MKANELMIGVWVTSKKWREKPFRLTRINDGGKYYYGITAEGSQVGPFLIEELEPIPLTAEILEKNGFGFTRNDNTGSVWNGWWIYKGLELATACLDKEGNWPCFINIYDSNIKCEYVHQLQHALRLCGIEKEIEL